MIRLKDRNDNVAQTTKGIIFTLFDQLFELQKQYKTVREERKEKLRALLHYYDGLSNVFSNDVRRMNECIVKLSTTGQYAYFYQEWLKVRGLAVDTNITAVDEEKPEDILNDATTKQSGDTATVQALPQQVDIQGN